MPVRRNIKSLIEIKDSITDEQEERILRRYRQFIDSNYYKNHRRQIDAYLSALKKEPSYKRRNVPQKRKPTTETTKFTIDLNGKPYEQIKRNQNVHRHNADLLNVDYNKFMPVETKNELLSLASSMQKRKLNLKEFIDYFFYVAYERRNRIKDIDIDMMGIFQSLFK